MKLLKIAFLFFLVITLFQITSCNRNEVVKSGQFASLDSVKYYIEKMREQDISDTLSLQYANKGLQFSENLNDKKTNILGYKTQLFWKLNKLDSAIVVSKKLLDLSNMDNDSISIGKSYARLAYYYSANNQKDSAYYFIRKGNEISLNLNDSLNIGRNFAQIAVLQSDFGDFNESDHSAIQALKYLKADDSEYLSAIYNCMAISSKKQKDYVEAIYWYDKAINTAADRTNEVKYLNHKANALRYLDEFDESTNIFQELLKDSTLENNPKTKARIIDNLAFAKWLANNNLEVIGDLELALTIREQENDLYGLNASYAHLTEYYKKTNPKKSKKYASKMYNLANRQQIPLDQLEALKMLIELEDSDTTKDYYNSYIKINDSLVDAEKSVQNKYAKVKYDSEKNREENLQLKINATEKELALQKATTKEIIFGLTGSSLILGLFIVGYYKRQKYKQEKQAEVYKTETRIAKKVHDEVANDVVNIMNKIQYANRTPNEVLDDLESVYLLTRDISRENNSIETGERFEGHLKSMLASFNSAQTKIIIKDIDKVALASISSENQIELFRMLQELMVNMRKHSEATLVLLSFQLLKNQYTISYSDNGIGTNINETIFKSGLKNAETRIKSMDGTITFESTIGNGFKALLRFKK